MKKKKTLQTLVFITIFIFILTGCTVTAQRITSWAQNLKAEDISVMTAWTSNFGDNYESNEVQLNDEEIQEVVTLINSLNENDFTLNKHNAGTTPEYGLILTIGDTDYSFTDERFGLWFEGKHWWIDCEELRLLIVEKSGWSPTPIWDGTVTGTDIKIPVSGEPTSGTNIRTSDTEVDNTEFGMPPSERIPVVGLLTGKVEDITSVTIEHADGRVCQLENPQSNDIIAILSTMDAEELPNPYHYEMWFLNDVFTITVKYSNSETDIITHKSEVDIAYYINEENISFHRRLEKFGSRGDFGFVIGTDSELLLMLVNALD